MKPKAYNPLQLDVAALARDDVSLSGSWPLASLQRLAASVHPDVRPAADEAVDWSVRGERRSASGAAPEIWLHLDARALLRLQCQRCLDPMAVPLAAQQSLRFVDGEQQAAALDADSDHDVLALPRALDLRELIEDELLLALPLVPRHEHCPQPLPVALDGGAESRNPFAVLEALKTPGPPKTGH